MYEKEYKYNLETNFSVLLPLHQNITQSSFCDNRARTDFENNTQR